MNVDAISLYGLDRPTQSQKDGSVVEVLQSDEDVVEALRSTARGVEPSHWPILWDGIAALLLSSRVAKVRNAAALALVDMRYPRLAEMLTSVLARQDVAEAAGTLLFAADEAGLDVTFEILLNIVEFGSYEARAELMVLLEKGRMAVLDDAHRRALRVEFARLGLSSTEGVAEAARAASDMLNLNA